MNTSQSKQIQQQQQQYEQYMLMQQNQTFSTQFEEALQYSHRSQSKQNHQIQSQQIIQNNKLQPISTKLTESNHKNQQKSQLQNCQNKNSRQNAQSDKSKILQQQLKSVLQQKKLLSTRFDKLSSSQISKRQSQSNHKFSNSSVISPIQDKSQGIKPFQCSNQNKRNSIGSNQVLTQNYKQNSLSNLGGKQQSIQYQQSIVNNKFQIALQELELVDKVSNYSSNRSGNSIQVYQKSSSRDRTQRDQSLSKNTINIKEQKEVVDQHRQNLVSPQIQEVDVIKLNQFGDSENIKSKIAKHSKNLNSSSLMVDKFIERALQRYKSQDQNDGKTSQMKSRQSAIKALQENLSCVQSSDSQYQSQNNETQVFRDIDTNTMSFQNSQNSNQKSQTQVARKKENNDKINIRKSCSKSIEESKKRLNQIITNSNTLKNYSSLKSKNYTPQQVNLTSLTQNYNHSNSNIKADQSWNTLKSTREVSDFNLNLPNKSQKNISISNVENKTNHFDIQDLQDLQHNQILKTKCQKQIPTFQSHQKSKSLYQKFEQSSKCNIKSRTRKSLDISSQASIKTVFHHKNSMSQLSNNNKSQHTIVHKSQSISSIKDLRNHSQSNSETRFLLKTPDQNILSQLMTNRSRLLEISPISIESLKQQLKLVQLKINSYCKEISINLIKEFMKYQKTPPSKTGFKAARCICLLLNAFYGYSQFKESEFKQWEEIIHFFEFRFGMIMQDLENLRVKCETHKYNYNKELIEILKTKVLGIKHLDAQNYVHEFSPKSKNIVYKSVFCYAYYLLIYLNLKQSYDKQRDLTSRSNSPYTVFNDNHSNKLSQRNQLQGHQKQYNSLELPLQQNSKLIFDSDKKDNVANQILKTINRVLDKKLLKGKNIGQQQVRQEPSQITKNSKRSSKRNSVDINDSHPLTQVIIEEKTQKSQSTLLDIPLDQFELENFEALNLTQNIDSIDNRITLLSGDKSLQNINNCQSIYQSITQNLEKLDYLDQESIDFRMRPVRLGKKSRAYQLNLDQDQSNDQSNNLKYQEEFEQSEINCIDKQLATTLKQNIEQLGNNSQIKVEDLLQRVKQNSISYDETPSTVFVSSKKRLSMVMQSNSKLQSLETNRNQTQSVERIVEEFKLPEIHDTMEDTFSGTVVTLRARKVAQVNPVYNQEEINLDSERDSIIKLLKERRESSNERQRGTDLERKTLETIKNLIKKHTQGTNKVASQVATQNNINQVLEKTQSQTSIRSQSQANSDNEQSFSSQVSSQFKEIQTKKKIPSQYSKLKSYNHSRINSLKATSNLINDKMKNIDFDRISKADRLIAQYYKQ